MAAPLRGPSSTICRYDALGRRVLKQDADGSPDFATTLYFYDGWQCVEETNTSGTVKKRYVYGEGIDEVIRATIPEPTGMDIDDDSITGESAVHVYYHHNSLGSVVAVTDASGNVEESYEYTPYGEVASFDKNGTEITAASKTLIEQPFMFTGRRWDFEEESGLYYYRLRYYDPAVGRFVSRDPLGMWGDPAQLGNGQNYAGNNPVNRVDPLGLSTPEDQAIEEFGRRLKPRFDKHLENLGKIKAGKGPKELKELAEELEKQRYEQEADDLLREVADEFGIDLDDDDDGDGDGDFGGDDCGPDGGPDDRPDLDAIRRARELLDNNPDMSEDDRREIRRILREIEELNREDQEGEEWRGSRSQHGPVGAGNDLPTPGSPRTRGSTPSRRIGGTRPAPTRPPAPRPVTPRTPTPRYRWSSRFGRALGRALGRAWSAGSRARAGGKGQPGPWYE